MPLFDSLMSMVTPQVTNSIAGKLGETPDAIQKGLEGGVATLLGSLATKAAGNSAFLQQLLGMINHPANDPSVLSNLGGLASGNIPQAVKDLGSQLMTAAIGSPTQQSAVSDLVAKAAGLKASSASTLMGMVGPMVLGLFGKQASSGAGLTAASLGSSLSAELPGLSRYLPTGIGSVISGLGAGISAKVSSAVTEVESKGGGGWVLPALAGLILLGLLAWWFLKSPTPAPETAKAPEVTTPAVPSLWAALGELFKRKLADGTELSIPKFGVENRLIDFIEDASKPVDKTTWFDFDRLLFDTDKATLQPASQEQLSNVAAILKAYPKVKMRIGGYTDNTGDKAHNLTLSQERAANVMAELVKLGTDASRLDSKGYGEENPVASNDTEEGRAKNRRISIRVEQK